MNKRRLSAPFAFSSLQTGLRWISWTGYAVTPVFSDARQDSERQEAFDDLELEFCFVLLHGSP